MFFVLWLAACALIFILTDTPTAPTSSNYMIKRKSEKCVLCSIKFSTIHARTHTEVLRDIPYSKIQRRCSMYVNSKFIKSVP